MTLDIYRNGKLELSLSSWSAISILSLLVDREVYFLSSYSWKVRA
jgi:hypothetical protein